MAYQIPPTGLIEWLLGQEGWNHLTSFQAEFQFGRLPEGQRLEILKLYDIYTRGLTPARPEGIPASEELPTSIEFGGEQIDVSWTPFFTHTDDYGFEETLYLPIFSPNQFNASIFRTAMAQTYGADWENQFSSIADIDFRQAMLVSSYASIANTATEEWNINIDYLSPRAEEYLLKLTNELVTTQKLHEGAFENLITISQLPPMAERPPGAMGERRETSGGFYDPAQRLERIAKAMGRSAEELYQEDVEMARKEYALYPQHDILNLPQRIRGNVGWWPRQEEALKGRGYGVDPDGGAYYEQIPGTDLTYNIPDITRWSHTYLHELERKGQIGLRREVEKEHRKERREAKAKRHKEWQALQERARLASARPQRVAGI